MYLIFTHTSSKIKNWSKEDKGELRMHFDSGGDELPEGDQPSFVDIEPKAGTLVLFKSEKVPHEVNK